MREQKPHIVQQSYSPVSVTVYCTCGWYSKQTRRQNALARAAKLRAAVTRHLRDVEQREPKP